MISIEKFLGKRVEIPEDRRYVGSVGLWAKAEEQEIAFGFTEPWLVLNSGINDLDWIGKDGDRVAKGDAIVFAITGKISYVDAPLEKIIHFNPAVKQDPSLVSEDPYSNRSPRKRSGMLI